jgi:hypothetical protein
MAICGGSAKQDKRYANRGVRRAHKDALHSLIKAQDYEDLLLPHKYECAYNETYSWCRDGKQLYWEPSDYYNKEWFVQMMRK